ncbi:MAG: molybdenum cofactor guanylyltransferase MobA [Rhodospirillaceae bacterium]|jgi:molybdenum cofactor guanylyltransferase|nr:molybdenum cofactor guanylyltransferase MobA [Rhodospirillaceae bacterium]MBT6118791.1 molybdenum cofactor guanylyltransferase MobA [Rhodospirillaceae bacterium]
MTQKAPPVCGVLLAGGQSRRMGGGDKCLRPLGGRPILSHIVERARPQVEALVLNANGDPARFAEFGLPVAADRFEGFAGPLAGVLTGMEWTHENAPHCPLIATFPTDAPFFPSDLVEVMEESLRLGGAELACAASDGRLHPVFGLWPVRLAPALREALEGGARKVDDWTAGYRLIEVEFPSSGFDPFFNTNRPEDLDEAERLLAEHG